MARITSVLALALVLVCVGVVAAVAAVPAAKPTFYTMRAIAPENHQDSLSLIFDIDGKACNDAYGYQWSTVCNAPAMREGVVPTVTMTPPREGQWAWDGETRLIFTPRQPWQPDERFKVAVEAGTLAPRVRLASNTASVATPPLAARIDNSNLVIDRSPRSSHWVSFDMRFTYPVPTAITGKDFTMQVVPSGKGLALGAPELVWNAERTTLTVSAPITSLAEQPGVVEFTAKGLPGVWRWENDKRTIRKEAARESVRVPGKIGFLETSEVALQLVSNDKLQKEYRLNLGFNVLMRPKDVLQYVQVVQLPRLRTAEALNPTAWTEAPVLSDDDLKRATPLRLEALTPQEELSSTIPLRITPEPGSYIAVVKDPKLASPAGLSLGKTPANVLAVPERDATLNFLQPGHVLPLSSDKKLGFVGYELESVNWQVFHMRPEFLNIVAMSNPGLDWTVYGANQYATMEEGTIPLASSKEGKPQFGVLDLAPLLQGGEKGVLQVKLEGMRRNEKGELVRGEDERRFVLVTDLGLVLKQNFSGGYDVFACSLANGAAMEGVTLEVLGANGLPVQEAKTDSTGHSTLAPMQNLSPERQPSVLVARKGQDMAYLPLGSTSLEVDYSNFATGGRTGIAGQSLMAHVFSQRGLFRPGETMHFGAVVRKGDWSALPEAMPLRAVLRDPTGATVLDKTVTVPASGLVEVSWQSAEYSPTGNYWFTLQLPGDDEEALASCMAKLEEFLPDTLAVSTAFTPKLPRGWLREHEVTANITLTNLFGMPAPQRRVEGQLAVSPGRFGFPGWESYSFFQQTENLPLREVPLPATTSNDEGKAAFALDLRPFAGGVSAVALNVRGFEPGGGRAVETEHTFLVSQQERVVGYRTLTNLRFVPQGRQAMLELVSLNSNLEQVDPGPLTAVTSSRRYISTLMNDGGKLRNESVPQDTEIARSPVAFSLLEGKPEVRFPLVSTGTGEHVVQFYDASNTLVCQVPYYVAGNTVRVDGKQDQGTLRVELEKSDYNAGDTIRMAINVPFDGAGLITIERESVLAHIWFQAKAGESVQSIVLPQGFSGKGYVNVSFARSLASPDVYITPHVFAVASFQANMQERDLGLQATVPQRLRPGETLNVRMQAKTPGHALVFVVDEGILQLTGFRSPSPLQALLLDRGLDVRTFVNLGLVMPDNRLIQGMLPGFGGGLMASSFAMQNPFKRKSEPPVAFWSGIVPVGPEGSTVAVPIPDYYNGKLRVMAVGASATQAGAAQGAVFSRGDLILTPQVPVVVAPGDIFEASVAVMNNMEGSGKEAQVSVVLEHGPGLSLSGPLTHTFPLEEGAEKVVRFTATAGAEPGADFILTRASGSHSGQEFTAKRNATLSVRPASPRMGQLLSGFTGKSMNIPVGRKLFAYEATAQASASPLPLPMVQGLVRYLASYPYGCTEQLISKAMPYVLLLKHPELLSGSGESQEALHKRGQTLVNKAIAAIQQASSFRGVAQWPGDWEPNELITAYAADFLMEARTAGFGVPAMVEEGVINALRRSTVETAHNLREARNKAYGVWVLSRQGLITTEALMQLERALKSDIPGWQEDVTASLMAGSYSLLHLTNMAEERMGGFTGKATDFAPGGLFDPLAAASLHTAVLARQFPQRLTGGAKEYNAVVQNLLDIALDEMRGNRFASFSAAQAIRGILALAEHGSQDAPVAGLRCLSGAEQTLHQTGLVTLLEAPGCTEFALALPKEGSAGSYWQVFTEGFDKVPPAKASFEGLELHVEYLGPEGKPVATVPLGQKVTVRLRARTLGGPLDQAVLISLLPGGFEMVLPRDDDAQGSAGEDEAGEGEYDNSSYSSGASVTQRQERREDRMLVFTPLSPEEKEFTYTIQAVNVGQFTLPAAYAEGLYNRNMRANTAAGIIKVTPN
ncbi:alpha-2-macroglobulin [Desulfovibrio cuneatus]|uniref:alpha-2-macroglobulin n=1 Tax=Desulfovibrio cuneatus TaxID=159728 RepID=UPI0004802848|nr:MG2 domain-containing protein [Desulfovibrio cuneatus]